MKASKLKRVVVRGATWVGDAVMTVPALRALRILLPDSHITLATRSWARDLFADQDFVDEVLVSETDGLFGVIHESTDWSKKDFDLALLFPNSFAAAVVPMLARVPCRLGYATDRRSFL